ncbi:hypothetical protein PHJA_002405200 [Phtheirospermum japonicum]|uniref:Uncharacterized protein n=1 Tax=Phtheirospermum japonicum TaxID=374723 RepID=A0A830D887_9LAMI|nr:hypothetical protein PHJA_002405200 [Phtheirospermum japonicum]
MQPNFQPSLPFPPSNPRFSKPASSSSLNRSAAMSRTRPSPLPSSVSSPLHRFSLSRSPAELGAVASMLPLHSAVAVCKVDVVPELIVFELSSSFSGDGPVSSKVIMLADLRSYLLVSGTKAGLS